MSFLIEYVSGRLFINGVWGTVTTNGYFSCHHPSCPFSLKVVQERLNDLRVVVGVESVLFEHHNHDPTIKSKIKARNVMKQALEVVSLLPDDPGSVKFKAECEAWLQMAQKTSQEERDHLIDLEAVKIYALLHREMSASEVRRACKVDVHPHAISKMRKAALKEIDEATNVKDLVDHGGHHMLGHEGYEIVVFGTTAALLYLSETPIIQCDGTFTCVVLPFTQLYIFHAVLGNGVTYPMLYCLMTGKSEDLYVKLLNLIESIAMEKINKPIFKRPVEIMMDFETAMINAIGEVSTEAKVLCCFSTSQKPQEKQQEGHGTHQRCCG